MTVSNTDSISPYPLILFVPWALLLVPPNSEAAMQKDWNGHVADVVTAARGTDHPTCICVSVTRTQKV